MFKPRLQTAEIAEEELHAWKPSPRSPTFLCPLLRVWDCTSPIKQMDDYSLISTAPHMRLPTAETRRMALRNHLDSTNWNDGPCISFTTSADSTEYLARIRARTRSRGPQMVTAINPNIRIQKGLPVLNMAVEMRHYQLPYPLEASASHFDDRDYLCLWRVTPAEIFGQWKWSELEDHPRWYQDVVFPAFQASQWVGPRLLSELPKAPPLNPATASRTPAVAGPPPRAAATQPTPPAAAVSAPVAQVKDSPTERPQAAAPDGPARQTAAEPGPAEPQAAETPDADDAYDLVSHPGSDTEGEDEDGWTLMATSKTKPSAPAPAASPPK